MRGGRFYDDGGRRRGGDAAPWENAVLSFFGVPCFSLFRGVPLDLVATPVERGDLSTRYALASSSSERSRRR